MKFIASLLFTGVIGAVPSWWNVDKEDISLDDTIGFNPKHHGVTLNDLSDLLTDFGTVYDLLKEDRIPELGAGMESTGKRKRVQTERAREWYATKKPAVGVSETGQDKKSGAKSKGVDNKRRRRVTVLGDSTIVNSPDESGIEFSF
jgi:hypothetical protein